MTHRFCAFITTVIIGLLMIAPGARAATFDFEAIADASPGEFGAPSIVFNDSGIQLTATGRSFLNHLTTYNAYLDAGNAGLGVCKVLAVGQCNPSNDDSVTLNEIVQLSFNKLVTVTSITFRDGDHGTTFEGLAGFATGETGAVVLGDFSGFDPNNGDAISGVVSPFSSLQIIAGSTYQPFAEDVTRQLYVNDRSDR